MQLEVGAVIEGKVNGITNFGAFVSLPDGKSGLVHISEIANTYVNDVRDHLTEGDTVKVRILGLGDNGRVNLSIKRAEETPARPANSEHQRSRESGQRTNMRVSRSPRGSNQSAAAPAGEASFEDKLKQFMQESDNKISGNRLYTDRKNGSRRRRT